MLEAVREWWFGNGMRGLRLDVASSNARAVRCYARAGFVISGKFWRKAPELRGVNRAEAKWHFLEGHIRTGQGDPELRFFIMELRAG
jgi:hypothetical protein